MYLRACFFIFVGFLHSMKGTFSMNLFILKLLIKKPNKNSTTERVWMPVTAVKMFNQSNITRFLLHLHLQWKTRNISDYSCYFKISSIPATCTCAWDRSQTCILCRVININFSVRLTQLSCRGPLLVIRNQSSAMTQKTTFFKGRAHRVQVRRHHIRCQDVKAEFHEILRGLCENFEEDVHHFSSSHRRRQDSVPSCCIAAPKC